MQLFLYLPLLKKTPCIIVFINIFYSTPISPVSVCQRLYTYRSGVIALTGTVPSLGSANRAKKCRWLHDSCVHEILKTRCYVNEVTCISMLAMLPVAENATKPFGEFLSVLLSICVFFISVIYYQRPWPVDATIPLSSLSLQPKAVLLSKLIEKPPFELTWISAWSWTFNGQ